MSMTSESNAAQVDLIREIVALSYAAGLRAWLLGGWGIDALCGEIRREHHDIDLITRLEWRDELRTVVRELAGSIAEDTPQKLRFVANGIRCDAVFFHTDSQGLFVSDLVATDPLVYPWPPDSFPARFNGSLGGVDCWAISWAAQFVAKEGYKNVEPESTLREKDRADLRTIREHIPASEQEELRRFLPGVPRDNTVQPSA